MLYKRGNFIIYILPCTLLLFVIIYVIYFIFDSRLAYKKAEELLINAYIILISEYGNVTFHKINNINIAYIMSKTNRVISAEYVADCRIIEFINAKKIFDNTNHSLLADKSYQKIKLYLSFAVQ